MTTSKLAKIEIPKSSGPFELLKNWIDDYKKHTKVGYVAFNLATASKLGHVKNRFIVLQELTKDGILFNTNPNSPKVNHINENPNVAVSFLFSHSSFTRQVRIEGVAEQVAISNEQYQQLPFQAKMRAALIKEQSVEVDWDDLNRRHDELLKEIDAGLMEIDRAQDNLVIIKIAPRIFDFYYGPNHEIADRVLFKRQGETSWTYNHVTA